MKFRHITSKTHTLTEAVRYGAREERSILTNLEDFKFGIEIEMVLGDPGIPDTNIKYVLENPNSLDDIKLSDVYSNQVIYFFKEYPKALYDQDMLSDGSDFTVGIEPFYNPVRFYNSLIDIKPQTTPQNMALEITNFIYGATELVNLEDPDNIDELKRLSGTKKLSEYIICRMSDSKTRESLERAKELIKKVQDAWHDIALTFEPEMFELLEVKNNPRYLEPHKTKIERCFNLLMEFKEIIGAAQEIMTSSDADDIFVTYTLNWLSNNIITRYDVRKFIELYSDDSPLVFANRLLSHKNEFLRMILSRDILKDRIPYVNGTLGTIDEVHQALEEFPKKFEYVLIKEHDNQVEIIMRPVKGNDIANAYKEAFDIIRYLNSLGLTASEISGLHMSISYRDGKQEMDIAKFCLVSNLYNILNDNPSFMRGMVVDIFMFIKNGSTVESLARDLSRKPYTSTEAFNVVQQYITFGLDKLFMDKGLSLKYKSVNISTYYDSNGRVELRFFGGENYVSKEEEYFKYLIRCMYALKVACDPMEKRKEYQEALYRFANTSFEGHLGVSIARYVQTTNLYLELLGDGTESDLAARAQSTKDADQLTSILSNAFPMADQKLYSILNRIK